MQRTKEETFILFKEEVNEVLKDSSLPYERIIDFDIGLRTASIKFSNSLRGRYYFRYGILIQYLYATSDPPYQSLLAVDFFKTTPDGILKRVVVPGPRFNNILQRHLPRCLAEFDYQVVLMNALPPFQEEDPETLLQDFQQDDSYDIPFPPINEFLSLIKINGEMYLAKRRGRCFEYLPYKKFVPYRDILNHFLPFVQYIKHGVIKKIPKSSDLYLLNNHINKEGEEEEEEENDNIKEM